MPTFFTRVEKEDGEVEYQEVEDLAGNLTADDIPDSLVQVHPAYKKVDEERKKNLEESVERRKKLQESRKQIDELLAQVPGGDDEPEQEERPAPTTVDPDELVERAVQRLLEVQQEQQNQVTSRQKAITDAVTKYKLPKDTAKALNHVPLQVIDEVAQSLAAVGLVFEDSGGSGGDSETDIREQLAGLDKEIFAQDYENIFK